MSSADDTIPGAADADHMPARDLEEQRVHAAVRATLFGEPEPPETIGRFVVLERIGAGRSGVVYAALDDERQREVAVKLLHSESADERVRLARAAQAMAPLDHPNVLAVHEVGEHREQAFIAMDRVDGMTLGEWMDADVRPWEEVVGPLAQAGRGLAAAHAAGLVHGDFTPDNVFVGDDGVVHVADFGLAGDEATPAYMAPEQHRGFEPDAKSDQFSFCVVMWEALYGKRPFSGTARIDLMRAITQGRLTQPPPGSGAPARLRELLVRGLRPSPTDRHASMEALLAAIAAVRTPRRWVLATVALAVVAILAAFAFAGAS